MDSIDVELGFLIADYLERSTGCQKAAKVLSQELEEKKLLGQVTSWDGTKRATTVQDVRGRFGEMAPNQLKRLLTLLSSKQAKQGSLLKDTRRLSGGAVETFVLPEGMDFSQRLNQLLTQERAFKEELRKLDRGEFNVQTGGDVSASGGLKIIETRKSDLKVRLEKISAEIEHIRFSFRDSFLAKSRHSSNILDLMRTSQIGRRIEQKLIGPARQLGCDRLRVLKKIYGHKAYVYCVCVDKTGRWIVTGSDDALLKLWNARTGELCTTFRGHQEVICDLAIDDTSKYLVSCSSDKTVRLWELLTGRHIAVLNSHLRSVNVVRFDSKHNLIVTASDDGTSCVWDAKRMIEEDENQINQLIAATSSVQSNAGIVPPVGNEVVSAEELASAGITDMFVSAKAPLVLPHVKPYIHEVVDAPLSLDSGALFATTEVNTLSIRPQGGIIVTGSEDGKARIWAISKTIPASCLKADKLENMVNGQHVDGHNRLICTLPGHSDSISSVEWSSKGDRVLSGSSSDGTVVIWYWPQREYNNDSQPDLFTTPHRKVLTIASSGTESNAFSGASGQGMHVDRAEREQAATGTARTIKRQSLNRYKIPTLDSCTWSRDDSFVITLQSVKRRKDWDRTEYEDMVEFFNQRIKIWNSYTGDLIHNICAHRKPAFIVRSHPSDSNLFMTAGHDGQICVWDVRAGKILKKLQVCSQYGPLTILDGIFTPPGTSSASIAATDIGGRLILIGSEDGGAYAGAYPEQFLSTDYAELIRDADGNAMDARSQRPPHLVERSGIVDSQQVEYAVQPRPPDINQGNAFETTKWSSEELERNVKDRIDAVRRLERPIKMTEDTKMSTYKLKFQEIDRLIEESNQLYADKQQKIGGDKRKGPRGPRSKKSTPVAAQSGLLACERATGEVSGPQQNSNQSAVRTLRSNTQTRGSSSSSSSQHEHDRGSRRLAKERARGQIRQYQEFEESGQTQFALSSSSEEVDDDYEGGVVVEEEDDFEDEDDFEEEGGWDNEDDSEDGDRRRSGRRSKRRVRYSDNDGVYAGHVERSPPKRRQPKSGGRRTPAKSTSRYDRMWLQQTLPAKLLDPYTPQKGDIVVFCVQGYRKFREVFASNEPAPWLGEWKKTRMAGRSLSSKLCTV
uniref:BRWD/PHIP N-terminal domain-containing protein n=1 Tax=Mucochytrium quahogii TaxID=96639 RepID=A0A7S2W8B2_9STRA|mmetsp:Transcript_16153/g.35101  ORF Transcript_16153/g.35101 Transcript_16153/m.35101 type:complete len:1132 (+) Transcript_16153:209-3604(+)